MLILVGSNEVTFSTGFNHCPGLDSIWDSKTDGNPLTDWMTYPGLLSVTLIRCHTMTGNFPCRKTKFVDTDVKIEM